MIHFKSKRILIPVDFSETSMLAIKHGAFTAQLTKGDVFLLHVVNTHYVSQNLFMPTIDVTEGLEIENKVNEKMVQIADDIANEYGIKVECIIKSGSPSNEIVNVAKEIDASLIVMGTHGYSPMEELVIGSVALKVLTKGPCPTMAMSNTADHKGFNNILIPIDSSAHTRQKVNYAIEMAATFSATLHIVALLGKDEEDEESKMKVILRQIEKAAKDKKISYHTKIVSKVRNRAKTTIKQAEKLNADMIIIMTDQDAELSGFFLGPYAQQVIHLSKVPVVAVKPVDFTEGSDISILSGTSGL
jgi:nucleotide-binding universal stress UspA family protein